VTRAKRGGTTKGWLHWDTISRGGEESRGGRGVRRGLDVTQGKKKKHQAKETDGSKEVKETTRSNGGKKEKGGSYLGKRKAKAPYPDVRENREKYSHWGSVWVV